MVCVCRALFLFVGESGEMYTVAEFDRVLDFLRHWIRGPTDTPVSIGETHYPTLVPVNQHDESVIALISSFDDLIGHLGPDSEPHSAMCK